MTSAASANTFVKAFSEPAASSFSLPILASFSAEFDYARMNNWDGRGAVALSPMVERLAERLISKYAGVFHLVEVAPGRDSSLSFIWDDYRGNYVYLDIGPSDTVHLFYDVVGEPKWEGVSVASDPRVVDHLTRAFQFLRPRFDLPPVARILIPASRNIEYLLAA
jgi:hypothetical protein